MAATTPMPAFAPELIPPLLPEELLLCVTGFDDLLEPWSPLVTGMDGSTAIAGAGTDGVPGSVIPEGEGLVGVGIEGSPEVGAGLAGEGLTGIPEGGGAG